MLKSNFKHVPVDGVVRAQNKCEIHSFLLTGEVTGKNVTGIARVLKKDQYRLKTRGYPYFLCYEMEVASLFNVSFVSGCEQNLFRLYFS